MVSVQRWKSAQDYELGFWEAQARRIAHGTTSQLGWYEWRAQQLVARFERLGLARMTTGKIRIVEVGSGPIGISTFLSGQERIAVDPLADEYAKNPVLTELRSPLVDYRKGVGEELPCSSGACDLAIIENCIDHVHDVTGVMAELRRVLKPGGILYLTVNNRTRWGFVVHRVLSRLQIDRGHPHTFTPARTAALIRRSGFEPIDVQVGSYADAWREDLRSSERKAQLKALLGISEYVVSVIARRNA